MLAVYASEVARGWNLATIVFGSEGRKKQIVEHRAKVFKYRNKMQAMSRAGNISEVQANPWNPSRLTQSSLVAELYYDVMRIPAEASSARNVTVKCLRSMSGELREPSVFDSSVRDWILKYGLFSGASLSRVERVAWPSGEQRGAVAKRQIDARECLGQYVGHEWLEFEFSRLYPNETLEWYYSLRVSYAQNAKSEGQPITGLFGVGRPPPIPDGIEIVVDAGNNPASALAFVNDCRADISEPSLGPDDRSRRNAEFVYCAVGAVVLPFLVSVVPIASSEQILAYYGTGYTLDDQQLHTSISLAKNLSSSGVDDSRDNSTRPEVAVDSHSTTTQLRKSVTDEL